MEQPVRFKKNVLFHVLDSHGFESLSQFHPHTFYVVCSDSRHRVVVTFKATESPLMADRLMNVSFG